MPISETSIKIFSDLKAFVEPALESVGKRLDEFDARLKSIPAGAKGIDGKDADPEVIRLEVARAVAELPKPRDGTNGIDGKDVDPAFVQQLVLDAVAKVERIQGPIGEPGPIGLQGPIGPSGGEGTPGRDVDPALVTQLIEKHVALAVAAIPPAAPGNDGEPGRDFDPALMASEIEKQFATMAAEFVEGLNDDGR